MSFSWSATSARRGRGPPRSPPSRARPPGTCAHHRRLLHEQALERLERVEPGREHRLDGVRQLRRLDRALLGDPARHLLGEERVPAGALRHRRDHLVALGQERAHERAAVLVAQRARASAGWPSAARRPSSAAGRAARRAPGRRSISGARTHCARCSIASSMPSSAQWMSSNAITNGRLSAIASIPRRSAERNASRMRSGSSSSGTSSAGTSTPSSRPISAASRSECCRSLAHQLGHVGAELLPGLARTSPTRRCRTRRAAPRRAPRTRCRCRTAGSGPCAPWAPEGCSPRPRSNSRSSRDLPTPASPTTRHQVRACPRAPRARRGCRAHPAPGARPTSGDSLAGRHAPHGVLGDQADRLPGGHALGLALQLERLELVVLDRRVRGAHRALAHGDAAGPRRRSAAARPRSRCRRHRVGVAHRAREHLAGVHAHAQGEVHAVRAAPRSPRPSRPASRARRARRARRRPRAPPARRRSPSRCRRCTCRRSRRSAPPPAPSRSRARSTSDFTASGSIRSANGGVAGEVGEQHRDLAPLLGQSAGAPPGRGGCRAAPAARARSRSSCRSAPPAARACRRSGSAARAPPAVHAEARAGGVLGPQDAQVIGRD